MAETDNALVGLCQEQGCGAVVMCCVLDPARAKDNARFAADAVKRGYRLETWTVGRTRAATWDCEHVRAKRAKRGARSPQLALSGPETAGGEAQNG